VATDSPSGPLSGAPLSWPEQPGELPRQFASRTALEADLRSLFPEAEGSLSPTRGGRHQAEALLGRIQPARYAKGRNFLDGPVTRLSPYIRHGALSLAEVRDAVFARLQAPGGGGRPAGEKLINELGWRDYWQRLWQQLGDGIWRDQEELKTGHHPGAYTADLPGDVAEGRTGLACMDGFIAELHETGWLHNHARMWLAAYLVHWRRVRWQAGAQWFLRHLLDGDPASNNLSWQWVASSFSHKPYFFNRGNLERYSGGTFCRNCPLSEQGCPFDGSYEQLEAELFAPMPAIRSGGSDRPSRRQAGRGSATTANPSAFSRPTRRR
jgi:deoxyribodipyrimidine photo-lyase